MEAPQSAAEPSGTANRGLAATTRHQTPLVEVAGIRYGYNGSPVIGQLDFVLHEGEGVAIMAPVGAGKSTFLRILLGAQLPVSGERKRFPKPDAVGVAFQEDNLLPWLTVRENILLLNSLHRRGVENHKVDVLLEQLLLTKYEHFLPSELSSGMKQKVSLGRLLLYTPALYVLDEALAHVDELGRKSLCSTLANRIAIDNAGVVLVTHNPTDALQVADRILIGSARPLTIRAVFNNPVPRALRSLGPADTTFRRALDTLVALLNDA
jgi:NitT/TauT family transport system ATP-binding protein